MELLLVGLISAIVGGVIGIFIYRNNKKDIDPIASKLDEKWDEQVKPLLDKLEEQVKK